MLVNANELCFKIMREHKHSSFSLLITEFPAN